MLSQSSGVLYRTGPGGHEITSDKNGTYSASHWFDGFAQTHRFEVLPPTKGKYVTNITYNSRHTCSAIIEDVRKTGTRDIISFGQQPDPCESYFKKVMTAFHHFQQAGKKGEKGATNVNVDVTVSPNFPMPSSVPENEVSKEVTTNHREPDIKTLWLKTDNSTMQQINQATLEPLAVSRNDKLHPDLTGAFTAAHSLTDPITGDWYNYNLEVGREAIYRVFSVSAKTRETKIIAKISGPKFRPAYLHSMMMTEHYIVLCIYNSYFAWNGLKVLWTRNMLDAMDSDPNSKNLWLVIDRVHGRGLVAMYESDPFFAFHPVNAWEQSSTTDPGTVDIIADIPTYPNLDVLKRSLYANLRSSSSSALNYTAEKGNNSRPSLQRFKLPSISLNPDSVLDPTKIASKPITTLFTAPSHDTPELPTFNSSLATKPSQYIYGLCDRGHSTFVDSIIKYDTCTQTAKHWSQHAHSPGEPIFIADPEASQEDDGMLLSVVLDGNQGKSYLLCLDARDLEEVGRAEMDGVVGFGFHGCHVPGWR